MLVAPVVVAEDEAKDDQPPSVRGYWIVAPRTGDDGTPDILFQVVKTGCPQEQLDLKSAVETALTVIKHVFATDATLLNEYVKRLLSLSQAGLVGPEASTQVANAALLSLENEILARKAGPAKNAYMKKLGKWALGFGFAAAGIRYVADMWPFIFWDRLVPFSNVLFVWLGCMVGAWLSFATRKVDLKLTDLISIEDDRVEPSLRLVYVGLIAIVLTGFVTAGVVDIKIGGFSSGDIVKSGLAATVFGAICGFAEKVIGSSVLSRAANIAKF